MSKIMTTKEIGEKLQQARRRAGMSRECLAEAIGVSPQQLRKYETGENNINTERLQIAASSLSVPMQFFFTDQAVPLDGAEQLLVDCFRSIEDAHVKDALLTLALRASTTAPRP